MTKREFDYRYKQVIYQMNNSFWETWTCPQIYKYLKIECYLNYALFINSYMDRSWPKPRYRQDKIFDGYSTFTEIRMLLLSNFYEEAIRTREYLKWKL
jgi:hypothetical protein